MASRTASSRPTPTSMRTSFRLAPKRDAATRKTQSVTGGVRADVRGPSDRGASIWDVGWSVEAPLPAGVGLPPSRLSDEFQLRKTNAAGGRIRAHRHSIEPVTRAKTQAELDNDVYNRRHRFSRALESAMRIQEATGYAEGLESRSLFGINQLENMEARLEEHTLDPSHRVQQSPRQTAPRTRLSSPSPLNLGGDDDWDVPTDDDDADVPLPPPHRPSAQLRRRSLQETRDTIDRATGATLASYSLGVAAKAQSSPADYPERSGRMPLHHRPLSWEPLAPEENQTLRKRVRRLSVQAYGSLRTIVRSSKTSTESASPSREQMGGATKTVPFLSYTKGKHKQPEGGSRPKLTEDRLKLSADGRLTHGRFSNGRFSLAARFRKRASGWRPTSHGTADGGGGVGGNRATDSEQEGGGSLAELSRLPGMRANENSPHVSFQPQQRSPLVRRGSAGSERTQGDVPVPVQV